MLIRPFATQLVAWEPLLRINQRIAQIIVTEVGVDLAPFPDAEHLATWRGCVQARKKVSASAKVAKLGKVASGCSAP